MQAKFLNYDSEIVREAEITCTGRYTAPKVISFKRNFFELKRVTSMGEILVYGECHGAFLSSIELVKGVEYRD